jgi:hypothetical protein
VKANSNENPIKTAQNGSAAWWIMHQDLETEGHDI